MNILSLFNSFANHFSHILGNNNPRIYELESLINNSTNNLNISILKSIIEGLDLDYKKQSKIISNKISVFDTIHTVNNSSFSIFDNYRLDFYLNKRK